jgi:hypothetical protein
MNLTLKHVVVAIILMTQSVTRSQKWSRENSFQRAAKLPPWS